MKQCSKCKEIKELDCFQKRSSNKDGLHGFCKDCKREYDKKFDSLRAKWAIDNKDRLLELRKINRLHDNEMKKAWKKTPRGIETRRVYDREYARNRRKVDQNFKLKQNLSRRIRYALKNGKKTERTMELAGCDIQSLKAHITSKFLPGMSWENYGKWHIDHIVPCASFDLTSLENRRKCFHYTNLQPLWANDNFIKSNKIYSTTGSIQ